MKNVTSCLLSLIAIFLCSCSITHIQKKGTIVSESFDYETEFSKAKTVIVLPFEINGVAKNFLFDTGAEFSIIQRDSIKGRTSQVTGATNRKMKMGKEYVKSLKLGEIDFQNTFAQTADLIGLKNQIPNFGGIIGQPILNKANWLIDYPNKKIRVSNKNLADSTYTNIKIKREDGTPFTFISVNGAAHKVIIDFGSSSEFNLPKESKLAIQLLKQYDFKDNERERYTIGGLQTTQEKVGTVPLIKLGDLEFKNIKTTINISSQPRIGIGFFKDYVIYIENFTSSFKIKKRIK